MSHYDTVVQVVQARVNSLVAKSAGLSEVDALAKVFREDPALYRQYREAAGRQPATREASAARITHTPTGAEAEAMTKAAALVSKSAELSLSAALTQVFHADPELYRRYSREAGRRQADTAEPAATKTPVVAHPLADDILALAKAFRPDDPTGVGMLKVQQALGLLRETVLRKRAAA
jgi:hypothetical protein